MKLTKKGLVEALRILEKGGTTYKAAKKAKITIGYMYQLWKKYLARGEIPQIGLRVGRPTKHTRK